MTASEILSKWDPVSPVFTKAGAWLNILRIAATGGKGFSRQDMARVGAYPNASTLQIWLKAGIIRVEQTFEGGGNRRPPRARRTYWITPKGLKLLRLDPEQ